MSSNLQTLVDYKQLVEAPGDAIIVCDGDGSIRFWNSAAERIFGFTSSEVLGKSLDLIIPERFRQRHWSGYARTVSTGETRYAHDVLRVPALHKDGRPLSIAFTVGLLHKPQREVVGIVAVIRDDTKRFAEERDLRKRLAELEEKFLTPGKPNCAVTNIEPDSGIDEYMRERLMPAEGVIPHIPGMDIFGNTIPAGIVGGDLFEYVDFPVRFDIDARIQRALHLSKEFLEPLPSGKPIRNPVDDHVQWMQRTPGYTPGMETEYRFAKSSEQVRVAQKLNDLYSTAGILIVDAQGHGIISAKIAATVHSTFHALMLSELDRYGKTTPELFENINLRLASSVAARNELKMKRGESARETATMLYGEVRPGGQFRFVNFGHPPPLVFSAEYRKFININESGMVQFLALGLQIPADHPDRKRYYSVNFRQAEVDSSDLSEITLASPGDILVLYTDGVYDGSDKLGIELLEAVLRENYREPAKEICSALLDHAIKQDEQLRQNGEADMIDDKTLVIVKRT